MKNKAWLILIAISTLSCMPFAAQAAAPSIEPPSKETIAEARKIIAKMRANARGPYSHLQWVCKDGAVLPPKAGACTPHGGGHQYAKFSPLRERLAKLGFPVGTIYVALDRGVQAPDTRPFQRLRDLPFEQYLIDIDEGWVLHKALGYRGRLQIEDEQQFGRELLLEVISDPQITDSDLLLLRELAKVVPHAGAGQDPTREIRRLSQVLAEKNPRFEPLRAEIHGKPTQPTVARVKAWQSEHLLNGEQAALLNDLVEELDGIFGESGVAKRLASLAALFEKSDPDLAALVVGSQESRLAKAGKILSSVRKKFDASRGTPKTALLYLDAMTTLEAEIIAAVRSEPAPTDRAGALKRAGFLARATTDLGWVSPTEGQKLTGPIEAMQEIISNGGNTLPPANYSDIIKNLQLAPAWAQGLVRHTFAEPLSKYTALDARSARFVDDLLRGSILQPLSEITETLARDDRNLSGREARLMGKTVNAIALNPGQAEGVLRVLEADGNGHLPAYEPDDIVVIPNTTSELFPAAGIVTVGEGNPLSHIQILARNLGIPNIVIDNAVRQDLKSHDGKRVMLAATKDGRVLMTLAEEKLTDTSETLETPTQISRSGTVPAPIPNLSSIDPIALSELRAKLSGVVVGPKAANLGELAFLFPDRVAPAVALPFGAFAQHTEAKPNAPRLKLKEAFAEFDEGTLTEEAFLSALDNARKQTAALTLRAETREKLEAIISKNFKDGAGLFIRSDTNMEDLPQFTGAGLNLTLPNVTGRDKQIAGISRVWASVYTRRAMAWRSQILSNPDDVFSSILLMQSVPSEKSGVMVTTDLTGGDVKYGLTVSVAWGVGGAVDNESAASYLLTPQNTKLLSEAKAPYQRHLKDAGGVGWKPAASGPILTPDEALELRKLASEVTERYPPSLDDDGNPLPFDIEFGFADGVLNLLQIRPLVQRGALAAEATVSAVIPKPKPRQPVKLMADLGTIEPAAVIERPAAKRETKKKARSWFWWRNKEGKSDEK